MVFARVHTRLRPVAAAASLSVLAACAAPAPKEIPQNDPIEGFNRGVHSVNTGLDRYVLRPVATAAAPVLTGPVGTGITNFSKNLGMPSAIGNKILQGEVEDAAHNFWRFFVNSTIGIAGLFDPATPMGLPARDTDFGVTLHTWGVGEGAFVMLPVFGPSTARDTAGLIVDTLADPVNSVLDVRERNAKRGIYALSKLSDRARYGDTVDSLLYESADSYAQTRLMYLQNRRFELGQEAGDDAFIDPYENTDGN